MKCRHCQAQLEHVFLDLGFAPPSNAYLSSEDLHKPELTLPLKLYVCDRCWLVQTEDSVQADVLFGPDYAYFSSASTSWLNHAEKYSSMICARLGLDQNSFVVEVASNDGYLLKNFVALGVPCLGIEPTADTAAAAAALGVPVEQEFFGSALARRLALENKQADLIIGNNVFAHVPDINDFTSGLKILLRPSGTITLEFPHLLRLIEGVLFDTVYHEHFSYLSFHTVSRIFVQAGLKVCDVEQFPTQGGSLRIYGCHWDDPRVPTSAVAALLDRERGYGLQDLKLYQTFQSRANQVKDNLLRFLLEQKHFGKVVAAYGAAAKGNTLLNYAGVKPDLLPYVCDAAPSKQGKFLPGSHIPILPPSALAERKPDWVLILPWNIAEEVMQQQAVVRDWGGRFVTAVPHVRFL